MNTILYGTIALGFFYGYINFHHVDIPKEPSSLKPIIEKLQKSEQISEIPQKDIICLAKNIYYEARGEDLKEQISVGQVVLNRKKDERYPKTVCGVVYQPYQFSWTNTRPYEISEYRAWIIAKKIAQDLLAKRITVDYTNGATHYHRKDIKPRWSYVGVDKKYLTAHVYMKVEN